MINRESEAYRIGLMEYAYKEIGFYGMCSLLSNSTIEFRRLSSVARDNMENKYNLLVMEGYHNESANEFIYDNNRLTKKKALKMQSNIDKIMSDIIDEYEKTFVCLP